MIADYERLSKQYGRDRRWRIEHFQIADPMDISRLAPAGIIASMQPTHQTSDRLMAEARLGPDRLGGAYAWQSVLKSGARLAFGSDFPVESPNPFPGLAAAVSRQDMEGQPPGGWLPQERVSFAQALSGFTRDAAYAGFSEDRIGALEPGKWADFILVDRDVSAVDAQALARTQVLETWLAGKKVWERPVSVAESRCPGFDIWKGGDDALTNKLSDALRAEQSRRHGSGRQPECSNSLLIRSNVRLLGIGTDAFSYDIDLFSAKPTNTPYASFSGTCRASDNTSCAREISDRAEESRAATGPAGGGVERGK